jgi:hypothetical protein
MCGESVCDMSVDMYTICAVYYVCECVECGSGMSVGMCVCVVSVTSVSVT